MNINSLYHKCFRAFYMILFCLSGNYAYCESLPKSSLDSAYQSIHDFPEKSIEIAEKLYRLSDLPKDKITSLLIIAQAYTSKNDYQKSFEYAFAAQKIAKENDDYNNQILITCFISRQYYHLRINDKAWEYLKEAEYLMKNYTIPKEFEYIKGNYYLLKGYLLQADLNCENAIYYFEKAINFYQNLPSKNEVAQINLAFSHGHKAHCLIEIGKYESAFVSLEKSSSISSKINNNGLEIFAKIGFAQIHRHQKEFSQSNQILIPTLRSIENGDYKDLSIEIYKLMSENYLSLNDIQNHQHYQSLYKRDKLSLQKAEITSINSLIDINDPKSENSSIFYNVIIILLGLICVFVYWKIGHLYFITQRIKKI